MPKEKPDTVEVKEAAAALKGIDAQKDALRAEISKGVKAGTIDSADGTKISNALGRHPEDAAQVLSRAAKGLDSPEEEKAYKAAAALIKQEVRIFNNLSPEVADRAYDLAGEKDSVTLKTGFMANPGAAGVKIGYPRAVTTPEVEHAPGKPAVTASAPKASH